MHSHTLQEMFYWKYFELSAAIVEMEIFENSQCYKNISI